MSNQPTLKNKLKGYMFIAIVSLPLLLLTVFGCFIIFGSNESTEIKTETQSSKHDGWIENQFSKLDGRHIKLVQLIKPRLNDPKSFEHVETHYSRQGDDIIVFMTYRAKNQYGAVMMGSVKAKVCYSNDVIEIL